MRELLRLPARDESPRGLVCCRKSFISLFTCLQGIYSNRTMCWPVHRDLSSRDDEKSVPQARTLEPLRWTCSAEQEPWALLCNEMLWDVGLGRPEEHWGHKVCVGGWVWGEDRGCLVWLIGRINNMISNIAIKIKTPIVALILLSLG